jgi:hypothetical protein
MYWRDKRSHEIDFEFNSGDSILNSRNYLSPELPKIFP